MSKTRDKLSLAGVYEFRSGLSKPRSAFGTGAPFLSFKDVFYNSAVPEPLKELVESSAKEQHNCSVRRGDVFLTRTSETMDELGMSCVALKDIPGATFNGFCKRLRPKVADQIVPEYARYFFRSKRFRDQVNAMATMSTRASLNNEMLERLEIDTPAIVEQSAIGAILGTLDEKIELNHKMNQTLEEIAKAIFKSWFVDFDPVRAKAEGRPTGLPPEISDLFPDELVDSEIGEIPKGWDIGSISDFAFLNKKTVNPSQSSEIYEHFSIPAFDTGQSPVLDLGTDIKSNKTLVVEGSLLVSKLNPNTPRVWLPNPKNRYEQICSTEFMVFTATAKSNVAFLWGLFTSSVVAERMEAMVTGTSKSHQRVKPNDVSNITVVTPDARLMKAYGGTVLPMLDRTLVGKSESRVVAELRDTLLPKLISGDLRIPDAEKFLEEAGL